MKRIVAGLAALVIGAAALAQGANAPTDKTHANAPTDKSLANAPARNKYFSDWPAGTDPREVGKRVAERFIPTPHMDMPNHGPQALHYSHVATWTGALQFAA